MTYGGNIAVIRRGNMIPELIIGDNANSLIYTALDTIMTRGTVVVPRDNLETKEITHVLLHLADIDNCFINMPFRKNNIFACVAECLWVLGGRGDMEFLSRYLPRAPEYSDDGVVWRAAYGPRLRNYHGSYDQIKYIVDHLKDNPNSRQAVMTIWDPSMDHIRPSKDFPCCNWIHLLIRDNKLECSVAIRSNDVLFGLSQINIAEFSFIQKVIASILKVETGSLSIYSDSLHLYKPFYSRATEILENKIDFDYSKFEKPVFNLTSLENLDNIINEWFIHEELLNNDVESGSRLFLEFLDSISYSGMEEYLSIPIIDLLLKKNELDMAHILVEYCSSNTLLNYLVKERVKRMEE